MAAKESLDQDITLSQVPYTDLESHINFFISRKWQERWSSCRDNKLFQIKPTLGEWPPGCRRSRKEEVVLSRLRIGHTYFHFDRKLSFIPHINYLKAKCQKALQLLRVVAHTDWGADKLTLLKLYRSLVRSKLDYGCLYMGQPGSLIFAVLTPFITWV